MTITLPKHYYIKSIGIVLFVLILLGLDLSKVGETLRRFDHRLILFSVPVFFTLMLIKASRWFLISLAQGVDNLNFGQMYIVYIESYFAGSVTPGRLGEIIKYRYIHSQGVSIAASLYSVIMDRLYDIVVVVVIAYLGTIAFVSQLQREFVFISFVFLTIALCVVVLVYKRQWVGAIFAKFLYKIAGEKLESIYYDYINVLKNTQLWNVLVIFLLSLSGWMLSFYQLFLFANGLSIKLSYLQTSLCIAISSFFSLIPITIFGIGTRDVSLIVLFGILGLSKEQAVSFSVMNLFLFLFNAFLAVPFWIFKRK